ncbi:uncharacterized protein LOC101748451 isoform X4 [Gallus gallus]|uniref:uncharacterized protein LOC101748451 isoform X4 n=1 Tax=Gallus gallus TaxID=9031 RepID=UPI001AE4F4EB|nr:uncharacterized protein LOC101748451 isoform X4 [Gallus gallus]
MTGCQIQNETASVSVTHVKKGTRVYLQTTSAVTELAARKNRVSLCIWIRRRNHCTFAAPQQQTAVYQLRIPGDMNDTCTNSSINPRVELFQLIMYTPTFILGLLFNVMALSFLFFPAKKLSESTVYLIALIFLDTLLLFTLPFKIISYHLQNKWKLGPLHRYPAPFHGSHPALHQESCSGLCCHLPGHLSWECVHFPVS